MAPHRRQQRGSPVGGATDRRAKSECAAYCELSVLFIVCYLFIIKAALLEELLIVEPRVSALRIVNRQFSLY